MDRIYITADLHLGHDQPFLFQARGFDNIFDHDKAIVTNWNELIDDGDTVYILGDLMLNDLEYASKMFNQLQGLKIIVRGNHDTDNKVSMYLALRGVAAIEEAASLKYGKYHFYLTHYPTITSPSDVHKPLKSRLINLCGHVHTKNKFRDMGLGLIYHCELDAHDMKPIVLDDIITDIKEYLHEDN